MPHIEITSKDNEKLNLYYEDYGQGEPLILIHGWPLTHRAWEPQMADLIHHNYRVITYDRRGFGQSDKPWGEYDYDTLASDLKGLMDVLGLDKVNIAGFSMGGGEVARFIGKFGTDRLNSAMLISAVTPYLLKDETNSDGVDQSVFEGMKKSVYMDRFSFIAEWAKNFTNYDENTDKISQEQLDFMWQQTTVALPHAMIRCIDAFGTTDFRDDLKKCDIPLLVVHGKADRICPIEKCSDKIAEFVPHAQIEAFDGGPHGLNMTHRGQLNDLMIKFLDENTKTDVKKSA